MVQSAAWNWRTMVSRAGSMYQMLAKMKEMMERLATLHTTPISTSRSQAVRCAHCVDQNSRQPFRFNLNAEVRLEFTGWSRYSEYKVEFDHPLTFTFVSTRQCIHLNKTNCKKLAL